jgi:hypothetical protein
LIGTLSRVCLLLLDGGRHRAHIDRHLPLDERDQQVKTRSRGSRIFAELEDHRPFILIGNPHRGEEEKKKEDSQEKNDHHRIVLVCISQPDPPF